MLYTKYYRFFRGTEAVLAILFGIPLILRAFNKISPWTVMDCFGIFLLISGISLMISAAIIRLKFQGWQLLLLEGLTGVITGIIILSGQRIPFPVFFTMAGVWTLVKGFFLFLQCRRMPEIISDIRNLLFIGILSIPAGIMLIWHPVKNALGLFIMLGIYTIIYGIVFLRDISGSRKNAGLDENH